MLRLTILSSTRMVVIPFTDSLSPTLTASLSLSRHSRSHQILQSPVNVFPCWLSVRLICVNQNSDVFLRRSIQPSLSYTHCHGAYVAQRHRRQYQIRKNRNRDLLILFSVCVLCFFLIKKYVLTEKSQKNKLICVSVYVWDCDCDLYFLFWWWKICINKEEREREKKKWKISHYGIMHILVLKILHKMIWCKNFFFFLLHILSWLGLFLASGP